MIKDKIRQFNMQVFIATAVGLLAGYLDSPLIFSGAEVISDIFLNLLKLVSLPIIFLSIVSTASGMNSLNEIRSLGQRVIKYTLLTTILAATVAYLIYLAIDPVGVQVQLQSGEAEASSVKGSYYDYFLKSIPGNIVQPFSENHVMGVSFLAMLLSLSILALPQQNRTVLHSFFSSLYAAIMKVTTWIVRGMPLAICAFIALFIRDYREGLDAKSIALYLSCVVAANLIQAGVILPAFLKIKGVSPVKTFRGMLPALSVAFFSKSSSATLPMAMRCAQENLKLSNKVSSFALPLCTTINMNGCAAFIFTTVMFVSMSNGQVFSGAEMIVWIFIATVAAVGNAGVPMGCYFLSGALLAAMNVPLNLMGVILPFYSLIDMLETAINVWSDSCVTAVVDGEVAKEIAAGQPMPEPEELDVQATRCC
jgi:Na+/H+-dicarboxylate symporter